jgi:hypothetical protein
MLVQNDGLGQSQLFEFNDGRLWAMSNKINAFKALDVKLKPEPEQWAVWSTLSRFPLTMAGYQNIRFLGPASQLRLNSTGIKRRKFDILSDWVNPQIQMSSEECLELARSSLLQQIQAGMPLWKKLSVGLSGGWDSRAIVSTAEQ